MNFIYKYLLLAHYYEKNRQKNNNNIHLNRSHSR